MTCTQALRLMPQIVADVVVAAIPINSDRTPTIR